MLDEKIERDVMYQWIRRSSGLQSLMQLLKFNGTDSITYAILFQK